MEYFSREFLVDLFSDQWVNKSRDQWDSFMRDVLGEYDVKRMD